MIVLYLYYLFLDLDFFRLLKLFDNVKKVFGDQSFPI